MEVHQEILLSFLFPFGIPEVASSTKMPRANCQSSPEHPLHTGSASPEMPAVAPSFRIDASPYGRTKNDWRKTPEPNTFSPRDACHTPLPTAILADAEHPQMIYLYMA